MKNTQIVAERIKIQAKEKGVSVKKLLESCGLGVNTVIKMANGTDIVSQNLLKIADYLECSADYLLGRTDNPEISTNNHNIAPNMSHANFGTVGGNVGGNVSNALGENITINATEPATSDISSEYECIIMFLNSLDKKERRHAIVDIQCMLEEDYEVKKNNK